MRDSRDTLLLYFPILWLGEMFHALSGPNPVYHLILALHTTMAISMVFKFSSTSDDRVMSHLMIGVFMVMYHMLFGANTIVSMIHAWTYSIPIGAAMGFVMFCDD